MKAGTMKSVFILLACDTVPEERSKLKYKTVTQFSKFTKCPFARIVLKTI